MTPEPTDKLDAATQGRGERTRGRPAPNEWIVRPRAYRTSPGLAQPDAGRLARPVPRGAGPAMGPAYPTESSARRLLDDLGFVSTRRLSRASWKFMVAAVPGDGYTVRGAMWPPRLGE